MALKPDGGKMKALLALHAEKRVIVVLWGQLDIGLADPGLAPGPARHEPVSSKLTVSRRGKHRVIGAGR